MKKHVVKVVYEIATTTSKHYIRSHLNNWQIGGPGVIVLVDTYPEGHHTFTTTRPTVSSTKPILCLAEVKDVPPGYWFESLPRISRSNVQQVREIKERVLQTIETIVLPGSVLVARHNATVCSFDDLQSLRHLYPTIVSVEQLAQFDCEQRGIASIMEVIWRLAVDICEEAQFYSASQVQHYLMMHMWRRKFGSESFEMLLNQFADAI